MIVSLVFQFDPIFRHTSLFAALQSVKMKEILLRDIEREKKNDCIIQHWNNRSMVSNTKTIYIYMIKLIAPLKNSNFDDDFQKKEKTKCVNEHMIGSASRDFYFIISFLTISNVLIQFFFILCEMLIFCRCKLN